MRFTGLGGVGTRVGPRTRVDLVRCGEEDGGRCRFGILRVKGNDGCWESGRILGGEGDGRDFRRIP